MKENEEVLLRKIRVLIEDSSKDTKKEINELRKEINELSKDTKKEINELRKEIGSKEYESDLGFDPDTESSFGYGRPSFGRSGLVFKEIELSRAENEIYEIVKDLWEENSKQNEGKGVNAGQVKEKDPKERSLNLISYYLYKMYQYGYLDRYEGRKRVYYKPLY